jgi:hypothetical protein
MSKITHSFNLLTLLMLGLFAGAANATYINGSISASGGLVVDPAATTFITSQLNVLQGIGTGVSNTGTGDYSSIVNGTTAVLQLLNISTMTAMNGSVIFTIGAFTFTGSEIFSGPVRNPLNGTSGNLSDAVTLRFLGIVSAVGFQDSNFLADFTGNGTCNGTSSAPFSCTSNVTGSWSTSIASNGQPPLPVPESSILSLLGIGLVAIGYANRRRNVATGDYVGIKTT